MVNLLIDGSYTKYLKMPIVLAMIGSLIYYIIERFDCYINARKTTSLTRRTSIVFVILIISLYIITMDESVQKGGEIFTDIGNF
jgi:hypothetical protein